DVEKFFRLPAEVALRLLGRAIARAGDEGTIRLGKLETLYETLVRASAGKTLRLRRTLGGALVTLTPMKLVVERAPARRRRPPAPHDPAGRPRRGAQESPACLNCGQMSQPCHLQSPLERSTELTWFPWQRSPRHLNCTRMAVNRPISCRTNGLRTFQRPRRTWDERQPAQLRPLGDHRSLAARAVHPVPEPGPAHHVAGYFLLATVE